MEATDINTKADFIHVTTALLDPKTSAETKEQADKLLTHLYKTPQAWKISQEILADPKSCDSNCIFTIAKILRVKVMYYFNELDTDSWIPLFGFILKSIKETHVKAARLMLAESMMIIYMRIFEVRPPNPRKSPTSSRSWLRTSRRRPRRTATASWRSWRCCPSSWSTRRS